MSTPLSPEFHDAMHAAWSRWSEESERIAANAYAAVLSAAPPEDVAATMAAVEADAARYRRPDR